MPENEEFPLKPGDPKPEDSTTSAPPKPRRTVGFGPSMANAIAPPGLEDKEQRKKWGLPENENEPGWYMIELNLLHSSGLQEVGPEFEKLYLSVIGEQKDEKYRPVQVSKTYYRCYMSVHQWRQLIRKDQDSPVNERLIYKVWPDFPVKPLIYRSVITVKADAAVRAYAASGDGICWAIIDSGISSKHIHFGGEKNPTFQTLTHPSVKDLHRDFTGLQKPTVDSVPAALTDNYGHGTHVAGIIAGGLVGVGNDAVRVYENVFVSDPSSDDPTPQQIPQEHPLQDYSAIRGIAPQCKLVSLKVLDDDGNGRASDIIRALTYIREEINGDPKLLRIHGVNLSIGYEFSAEMFACGQSPLCLEVDRLVKSGVVVVVAAGNTGYGKVSSIERSTEVGLSNTINDPGNSYLAITVGATHRESPHMYGVSYFSSKGPTGDGRLKPDLVAPGERITSCAAGKYLASNDGQIPDDLPAYIDDTGTSMAAPHVSGAIAAFLSIRREFILKPEEVKRIFMDSATSLNREAYFQGRGLLDLMRAIQSV